ncbi:hypothetical protein HNY73_012382 [Argiope bruennichi]|uniref:Uncharacterized protein n=1 Tax=Argiope bruennichi TaxID=94029 RepID=A0A8T0EZ72_ARGBR|nr:hypothetical protein HNY73_012382 [Argiope bruennichi]
MRVWCNEVVIEALEIDEISRAPIHVPDQRVYAEMKARRLELTFNYLAQNSLWWHGPPWMSQPNVFWPSKVEIENPLKIWMM